MAYIPCKIGGGRQPIEIPKIQFAPTWSASGKADNNIFSIKLDGKYTKLTIDSCVWNRMRFEYTSIYSIIGGTETQLVKLANAFNTQYELDITGAEILEFRFVGEANAYNYEPPKVTYNNVVIS